MRSSLASSVFDCCIDVSEASKSNAAIPIDHNVPGCHTSMDVSQPVQIVQSGDDVSQNSGNKKFGQAVLEASVYDVRTRSKFHEREHDPQLMTDDEVDVIRHDAFVSQQPGHKQFILRYDETQ